MCRGDYYQQKKGYVYVHTYYENHITWLLTHLNCKQLNAFLFIRFDKVAVSSGENKF